ncbi:MAG: bacteriohemerythrin [Desulfopila sp.]|jgi:hemerythrin|nr:bacteriohemerythrin [Desulfopila sp.]
MESFKWGTHFSTGLPGVDAQHQQLVRMINSFGQAIAENSLKEDFLTTTYVELGDYARLHFDTEEKLMQRSGLDPRHTKEHIRQHAEFVTDVAHFAETIDTGNIEDCRNLFKFLVHWLAYHILGADQNMARQVNAISSGTSSSEAFAQGESALNSSTEPLLAALHGLFSLVSQRNKALVKLNRTLEARVASRTEELAQANETLKVISVTDHLTQLPNRRFAMSQLELFWKERQLSCKPLSCLMVDADGFKTINDTYGHDAGDTVLQRLAQELQHAVRSDDIVCRLGGDEFLIICPNTDIKGALYLGEQTRAKVAALNIIAGDGLWQGSVSIGVASSEPAITDIDALMKEADKAVYLAKKDGRNCVRSTQKPG